MKTQIPFILISFLMCAILAACGPSQEELDATSTQVAADVFATQTAQAPTATATFTPSPTATQTPSPTDTPMPTNTPTPNIAATAEAYYNSGLDYQDQGDLDRAIKAYDQAIQINPDFADAYYQRGIAHLDNEEYDLAISDWGETIRMKPEFGEAYYNRANAYIERGDKEKAIADFNNAVKYCGDNAMLCENAQFLLTNLEAEDGKPILTYQAFSYLTNLGREWYDQGYYAEEIYLYDAMQEYAITPFELSVLLLLQGDTYEQLGQYDLAIENYLRILDFGDRQADVLNGICWDYAITNQPQLALPYCEEAVEKDPSAQNLDSRGVAYALLGKYAEAASDFKTALESGDYPSDEMYAQRQEWVTALEAGNNPITPNVLAQERQEKVSIETEPFYTGALKLSYVRQQMEEDGYVFEEATVAGQPALAGIQKNGSCTRGVLLLGTEQEFQGAIATITGCDHADLSSDVMVLTFSFSRDVSEIARALVWNSADYYYVIDGKPITDYSPNFGGFVFTVERTEVNGNEGIIVTAKPAE